MDRILDEGYRRSRLTRRVGIGAGVVSIVVAVLWWGLNVIRPSIKRTGFGFGESEGRLR